MGDYDEEWGANRPEDDRVRLGAEALVEHFGAEHYDPSKPTLLSKALHYAAIDAEIVLAGSCGPMVCACGLVMTKNPHPDAGVEVEAGYAYECIPCLVATRNRVGRERDQALEGLQVVWRRWRSGESAPPGEQAPTPNALLGGDKRVG